ncbi:MAG: tRNA (adenosine(37)-N6)-dimethylallyltransferase MiaA [Deltaproteobacteria bacterium]|nr:tRNA (adenosine(37)-N6)-dimethylallyltransferase MiaA [Deltaproteobacteria bacterium]
MKIKIIVICGPTAAGKSSLAVELAGLFNAEIISADSMQVYRHMDIGAAKPSKAERDGARHHMIDVVNPDADYNAARFRDDAATLVEEITNRRKNVIVSGGTGLYIKALTEGIFEGPQADEAMRRGLVEYAEANGREALYERLKEADPVAALSMHPNNLRRVVRAIEVCYLAKRPVSELHREHNFSARPYDTLKIGLCKEREALYADIEKRVDDMMAAGLVGETRALIAMGYQAGLKPMRGLGYKEMAGFLNKEYPLDEAVRLLKRNTRHYAKRQLTWFRKDAEIRWFNPALKKDIIKQIEVFLN